MAGCETLRSSNTAGAKVAIHVMCNDGDDPKNQNDCEEVAVDLDDVDMSEFSQDPIPKTAQTQISEQTDESELKCQHRGTCRNPVESLQQLLERQPSAQPVPAQFVSTPGLRERSLVVWLHNQLKISNCECPFLPFRVLCRLLLLLYFQVPLFGVFAKFLSSIVVPVSAAIVPLSVCF